MFLQKKKGELHTLAIRGIIAPQLRCGAMECDIAEIVDGILHREPGFRHENCFCDRSGGVRCFLPWHG